MKLLHNYFFCLAVWSSFFLLLGFMSPHAQQAPKCAPLPIIEAQLLAPPYGETRFAEGRTGGESKNWPVHFYASAHGTWTIILEPQPGVGCMIAAGTDFGPAKPAAKLQGPEL